MIKNTLLLLLTVATISLFGQDTLKNRKGGHYYFTVIKNLEANPVQNQWRTGTCWSFSALSFYESELMRKGKGHIKLSEMFIARNAYKHKAINHVRMSGHSNFSQGGAFHDIPYIISRYGIVPQSEYTGLQNGDSVHNHSELEAGLAGYVKAVAKKPQGKVLTPYWTKGVDGILDAYFGELPNSFNYNGGQYTAKSFAKMLDLNMDDYISITSYTHHPFYSSFTLEIPDNWAMRQTYNVPVDEMMEIAEGAIKKGYSIAWGSDVSEKGFSYRNGLAIVPMHDSLINTKGKSAKYFNSAGAQKTAPAFDHPMPEKTITQKMRQVAFDNQKTTDDHGMHITGIVKDQKGNKYFYVKNSWGTKYNACDGYFYCSFNYFKYKTMNYVIHKDALSKKMKKKLGIK